MIATVLVLGCGYAGAAVAREAIARGLRVVGTVRDPSRVPALRDAGVEVIVASELDAAHVAPFARADVHVVVAFPPDGATDARVAPHLARAAAVSYVSSTGVYGAVSRHVDDATPLPREPSARAARILDAEEAWRAIGAAVLRAPAIYGPDRGLHLRIVRGAHRIAGDGTTYTSRIHVADLARLLLASSKTRGATFVVGDAAPATQNEIAAWVASEYAVPLPPRVPPSEVPESLRSDRRVDGSRALRELGVTLAYPSYRDGMAKRASHA